VTSRILNWLSGRKKTELPGYTSLRSIPLHEIAPDLDENNESYTSSRSAIERILREPPRRPSEDSPLFTTLATTNRSGFVTIPLPDGRGQCVPVFSERVRAVDYRDICLATGPDVQYLESSAEQLVSLLRDLRSAGAEFVALDRCPRCAIFTSIGSGSLKTPDDALRLWSIVKATELARLDLFMRHALKSAHAGLFELARQVAFEAFAHVSPGDPRPHLLLGQLAVVFGDRELLADAKAFLRLLRFDAWERKLDQDERSGSLEFGQPEFFSKLQS
jgi:hypothetical protein